MIKSKDIGFGIVYYSTLIPETEHYFTTRKTNIEDNFEQHCSYLNISKENFIHPAQTHSSNIEFASADRTDFPETDAIILSDSTQAVYLRFADCTPVILYDKQANIGAVAHAGWRGTVDRIVPKTVEKMINYSHSDIKNIYAVIGPAIGSCCYNVGDEVVQKIKESVKCDDKIVCIRDNRPYVDLKEANKVQLLEIGVLPEHIDVCPFCTSCRNDLFYSYRKENGTIYRHNAVMKLH